MDQLAANFQRQATVGRNVDTNYPFERSHRFAGIQPNLGFGDYSRLSCRVGDTQLGRRPGSRQGCLRGRHQPSSREPDSRYCACWRLAGMNRMPWRAFLIANAAGGIIWAAVFGLGDDGRFGLAPSNSTQSKRPIRSRSCPSICAGSAPAHVFASRRDGRCNTSANSRAPRPWRKTDSA
jgi:hypothetical protein